MEATIWVIIQYRQVNPTLNETTNLPQTKQKGYTIGFSMGILIISPSFQLIQFNSNYLRGCKPIMMMKMHYIRGRVTVWTVKG